MRAIWNDVTLAQSDRTILLEGNVYFPPESVRAELLSKGRLVTICTWKGIAHYYTVEAAGERSPNVAWYYPRPWPWIRKIRNYVAFGPDVEIRSL